MVTLENQSQRELLYLDLSLLAVQQFILMRKID